MEDCGKFLYEYSSAKHALDMSKHERKRYIKSFTALWLLTCVLLLTVWCIVNFVLDLQLYNKFSVLKNYILMFFILGVIILIAILTVFGLWGVFMRRTSKFYRPRDPESRRRMEELQIEFQTADENKSRENALMIFDDRIVIITNGEKQVIDRNELTACSMIKSKAGIFLAFYRENNERIPLNCMPPVSDAYLIKKYLGDKLEEIKIPKSKRNRTAENIDNGNENQKSNTTENPAPKHSRAESGGAQIETGALVAGTICIAVGIMVVLLGYFRIMGDMPAIVGGFPIGIGLLFTVLAFHQYEIVNIFLIKFFVAVLLIFMGLMFLLIIEEGVTKSPVTVSSLLRHPTIYGIACLFFVSVGISIIPNAIKSLIDYFKYR